MRSGYVYTNIDNQQIDEIPYLIFMDISIEDNLEEQLNELSKTKLEVWEFNKSAVSLYKAFGYQEVEKSLMFSGINL